MSTFDIGSPVWKRAAKEWRRGWIDLADYYGEDSLDKWNAEATATRLRELLKRIMEHEGMIVFAAPNCGCGDCELVRDIEKELTDD